MIFKKIPYNIITTNNLWYYNIEYQTIIYNIIITNSCNITYNNQQ